MKALGGTQIIHLSNAIHWGAHRTNLDHEHAERKHGCRGDRVGPTMNLRRAQGCISVYPSSASHRGKLRSRHTSVAVVIDDNVELTRCVRPETGER